MLLRVILSPLLLVLLTISVVSANTTSERKQLQRDIKVLDQRLDKEQQKANALQSELRKIEQKLGEQTRKAYTLEKKIKQVTSNLQKTQEEKKQLAGQLSEQKKGLSQQLQALYSAGEQSHMRLLLKQDDPSDIGRTVKYFEYLNKSRVKNIQLINGTLTRLQEVESGIQKDKLELEKLSKELSVEKVASKDTLAKRKAAYDKVRKSVNYKKRQLKGLKRKEAKLQAKIDKLIADSRARAQATTPVQKKKQQEPKQNVAAKSPKKQGKQVGQNQRYVPNRKFSTLRGKLSWPVKGRIINAYGERRNERQRWKGTVIAASGGSAVKAVASGKVEFSGWFNGYGYLVIIRHDNNYRSLYGYNRAIYVKEGQVVKGGTTIAAVGNSGGQQQNALYFEIRKGAQPRNAAKWCR